MAEAHPDYIVIEGPIGVGKTTLAQRLARTFGTDLILEGAAENPFLPRFYQQPDSAALPTQLHFLFQRAQQIRSMNQADMFKPIQVADFLLEKDRLFAELTLDEDELKLYDQIFEQLVPDPPAPDLVIYLQAPVSVLKKRISQRGIVYEQNIGEDYLQRLIDSYVQFFYHYRKAPLLIVNAAEIDLTIDGSDYDQLLELLKDIPSGRNYFNSSGP